LISSRKSYSTLFTTTSLASEAFWNHSFSHWKIFSMIILCLLTATMTCRCNPKTKDRKSLLSDSKLYHSILSTAAISLKPENSFCSINFITRSKRHLLLQVGGEYNSAIRESYKRKCRIFQRLIDSLLLNYRKIEGSVRSFNKNTKASKIWWARIKILELKNCRILQRYSADQ